MSNYLAGNNEQTATQHPRRKILSATLLALGAAVADTAVLGSMPFTGDIASVTITPKANIVGADTNNRAYDLLVINETTGATLSTTPLYAGNAAAGTLTAFKANGTASLAAVAAVKNVPKGRILAIVSRANGTGAADPGGTVEAVITNGVSTVLA